jgi:hypothetical protein
LEKERREKERKRVEKERLEREKVEKERLERERVKHQQLEKERLERLEKERLKHQQLEKERLERLEKERLKHEQLEKERLKHEQLEKERLKHEQLEKERIEKERVEKEGLERERLEKLRMVRERVERERLEKERLEKTFTKIIENTKEDVIEIVIQEEIIKQKIVREIADDYIEFFIHTKKVCFITAIYGNYEASCKKFVNQTIPTDFICFTDNENMIPNGWIIDTTPYHTIYKSPLDNDQYVNSISNNKHTFNIAKYYKQAFQNIPRLKKYEVIVWLDGTIEIIYEKTSEYIMKKIHQHKIIGWHHEHRNGILKEEVKASDFERYTSTFWNNQIQPYQDVIKQMKDYVELDGYNAKFFKQFKSHTPHFGVWITCFVAFFNHDQTITDFLNLWYLQTLQYTTQDQIGFPYVCFKTKILPYTLPNHEIQGDCPHDQTQLYIKHSHGK